MTIIQYLFSFKGRINRAKFWLIMIMPLGLVIVGMLIGGILVAQSMITSAKSQQLCRELTKQGSFTGDCLDLMSIHREFKKLPVSDDSKDEILHAYDHCIAKTQNQPLKVSCDEYINIYPQLKAIESSPGTTASKPNATSMGLIFLVIIPLSIVMWWICLAVYAKRLHDYNLSGWWQVAPLGISILAGIVTMIIPILGGLLSLASFLASIALFVICGFLKGTSGPNAYGNDPLQK